MSTFGCQFWGFQPGYSLWKPRADLAWPLQLLLHVWPCFLHLIENPSNIVEYSRQPQLNKIIFQSQIWFVFFPEGGSSPWILQSRGVQGPRSPTAEGEQRFQLSSPRLAQHGSGSIEQGGHGLRSSHCSWHWVCHIRNVDDWFWRIFFGGDFESYSYSEILWKYMKIFGAVRTTDEGDDAFPIFMMKTLCWRFMNGNTPAAMGTKSTKIWYDQESIMIMYDQYG